MFSFGSVEDVCTERKVGKPFFEHKQKKLSKLPTWNIRPLFAIIVHLTTDGNIKKKKIKKKLTVHDETTKNNNNNYDRSIT